MKFDDEQQAFVDGLISRKYSEAYQRAQQTLAATAEAKYKTMLTEAYGKLRITELKAAAADHGAVDASQVAALLDGSIRVDNTGSLFVVDGEGERRFSADGSPLTVNAAVAAFLSENPHLTGPRPLTGTGSRRAEGFLVGYSRVIKRRDYDRLSPEVQMEKVFGGVRIVD